MPYIADYTTLADLKGRLNITDTADDTVLSAAITAASRAADDFTHRRFGLDGTVVARLFRPATSWNVPISDLGLAAGVTVETDDDDDGTFETTWASTDYRLSPINAPLEGRPFTRIERRAGGANRFVPWSQMVRVTGRWGWPSVPSEVAEATLIQAARLFRRGDAPFGVAGVEGIGVARLLTLDPDVRQMLVAYRRPTVV